MNTVPGYAFTKLKIVLVTFWHCWDSQKTKNHFEDSLWKSEENTKFEPYYFKNFCKNIFKNALRIETQTLYWINFDSTRWSFSLPFWNQPLTDALTETKFWLIIPFLDGGVSCVPCQYHYVTFLNFNILICVRFRREWPQKVFFTFKLDNARPHLPHCWASDSSFKWQST